MEERETVSWKELAWSNMIQQKAIVRVLVNKGLVNEKEILDEVKAVHREYLSQKT